MRSLVGCIRRLGERKEQKKTRTTRKKFMWIRSIKFLESISLVECKLFIYNSMVVLVKPLVLSNFLPHTMAIIVIGNGILMTFSPQEIFQDKVRIKL